MGYCALFLKRLIGGLGLLLPMMVQAENPARLNKMLAGYHKINWRQYTVKAVRHKVPKKFHGNDVILIPAENIYLLPVSNLLEMRAAWRKAGIFNPQAIVIANGVYDLARLARLIDDPNVFKRINAHTFISYQPIVVFPTASLVIRNQTLRLSLRHGTFLASFGLLFIVDSTVTSWDHKRGDPGPREKLPETQLLKTGVQFPRPYITIRAGGKIYAANSAFQGLGYKGKSSTFGMSMASQFDRKAAYISPLLGLKHSLHASALPTGWLIGNHFEDNFFGFYSRLASDAVIVGNAYYNNVIYNIDPHDDSRRLLIARNYVVNAGHAHGIIISRRVDDSIIGENLALGNVGSGIMTDRNSIRTLITGNITMANHGNGIGLSESDYAIVQANTAAYNWGNGIFIRNSCNISLRDNAFIHNSKYGGEVAAISLAYDKSRDLIADPYHLAAEGVFTANTFDNNYLAAAAAKGSPEVFMQKNRFVNSAPRYFSGDLEPFTHQILQENRSAGFHFKGEHGC